MSTATPSPGSRTSRSGETSDRPTAAGCWCLISSSEGSSFRAREWRCSAPTPPRRDASAARRSESWHAVPASASSSLTVAVTGPTGDIGRSLLRALDRSRDVKVVNAMARRPFDPEAAGLRKTRYRQGDVLDRDSVDRLVADADVVVHLAFLILGGLADIKSINIEGSRNVF